MTKSCVVLLSGGLDSLLAVKLMTVQGVAVTAVHTVNCFHSTENKEARMERLTAAARDLGARDIVFPDITDEVIAVVRRPRHGYGKNLNPCIDCRLRTVAAGFRVMRDVGADFVVSGEVVGQRPMSQRRDAIGLADREIAAWGFPGLFLRPLSAKVLPDTIPEIEGWVDPALLYGITGRSRHEQMALAEELGVVDYPSPAGGCLLTDSVFSGKLADLMRFTPEWTDADAELLKVGRHFLPAESTRIVVSRREEENYRLEALARPEDRLYINNARNGAVVLLRGESTPEAEAVAAGLAVYYSKMREAGTAEVKAWPGGAPDQTVWTKETPAVDPDAVREAERAMKKITTRPPVSRRKTNEN